MAAPLYFLPNSSQADIVAAGTGELNLDRLRELGIAGPFGDVRPGEFRAVELRTTGPGNLGGLLLEAFSPGRAGGRFGYYPDSQTWTEAGPGVWIGIDRLSPVTPADLVRRETVPGDVVRLTDGNGWQIPKVRTARGGTELPFAMWRDATGRLRQHVRANYRELWNWAAEVWGLLYNDGAVVWDLGEMLDYTTAVLAINYRFDVNVQRVVGLIDSTNWKTIVAASVDYYTLFELFDDSKKKALRERADVIVDGLS